MRHGEKYNKLVDLGLIKNIDETRLDGLSDRGFQQADTTANFFKNIKNKNCPKGEVFDYLYSSPLKRALQTADFFSKKLGMELNVCNFLEEFEDGLSMVEYIKLGEAVLKDLLELDGQNNIVVTHSILIKVLFVIISGIELKNSENLFSKLPTPHCSINKIDYYNEKWYVGTINSGFHLGELFPT